MSNGSKRTQVQDHSAANYRTQVWAWFPENLSVPDVAPSIPRFLSTIMASDGTMVAFMDILSTNIDLTRLEGKEASLESRRQQMADRISDGIRRMEEENLGRFVPGSKNEMGEMDALWRTNRGRGNRKLPFLLPSDSITKRLDFKLPRPPSQDLRQSDLDRQATVDTHAARLSSVDSQTARQVSIDSHTVRATSEAVPVAEPTRTSVKIQVSIPNRLMNSWYWSGNPPVTTPWNIVNGTITVLGDQPPQWADFKKTITESVNIGDVAKHSTGWERWVELEEQLCRGIERASRETGLGISNKWRIDPPEYGGLEEEDLDEDLLCRG